MNLREYYSKWIFEFNVNGEFEMSIAPALKVKGRFRNLKSENKIEITLQKSRWMDKDEIPEKMYGSIIKGLLYLTYSEDEDVNFELVLEKNK